MNVTAKFNFTCVPSARAYRRMLSQRGEPLFIAAWLDALMIHFEVDAKALQRDVPFELDLWNGRAFVSLVAFTMRGMRPRFGGKWTALLFHPIATHDFLNVRTYVRHGGECGIHFIAEWLTNRLAVMLGPPTFGLPYRYGRISYRRDLESGNFCGRVTDVRDDTSLAFEAETGSPFQESAESCCPKTLPHLGPLPLGEGESSSDGRLRQSIARFSKSSAFQPCVAGSLDEWLMERYVAFNSAKGNRRFFSVWHPPWPQAPAKVAVEEKSLLIKNWIWFEGARMVGANFSPGFGTVWMGRPRPVVNQRIIS